MSKKECSDKHIEELLKKINKDRQKELSKKQITHSSIPWGMKRNKK